MRHNKVKRRSAKLADPGDVIMTARREIMMLIDTGDPGTGACGVWLCIENGFDLRLVEMGIVILDSDVIISLSAI